MSQQLISRSPDLKELRDEGYEIAVKSGHLVIYNVPYVNSQKQVKRGILVSQLDLANDVATKPGTHVAMFAGEHPCDKEGRELVKIKNSSTRQHICDDLYVDHLFSSKPKEGYLDYHHKMTTYVTIISGQAEAIDPNASAKTFRVIASDDPDSVFNYVDTASSRARIVAVSKKLEGVNVAIVGLGGTGSYTLDLVSKTPAKEIHLFDGDYFLQHNAFRSPGAPPIDELGKKPKKVHYFRNIYSTMRKNIFANDFDIDKSNVEHLRGMDFVFLCVHGGEVKRPIIEKLEEFGIPFVDVGMGVEVVDQQLLGILRVTTSTADKRDHVRDKKRISFSGGRDDGLYSQNIQIADLNALNAALAVIKWKKLFGFYADFEKEHFTTYTIDGNSIANEDKS